MWIEQLKARPVGHAWGVSVKRDAEATDDEVALVAAAQANPAAFDALYQRYLARVYRYLRAQVDSDEDAADWRPLDIPF
jgi:hypothetical protein